jgi:hypothetical protein
MLDIMVRLKNVQFPCTCTSPSKLFMEHDQLCKYRIVQESEAEISTLRSQLRTIGKIVKRETA